MLEGKKSLRRPRCRRVSNIKIDILERERVAVYRIGLAEDKYSWRALFYAVMNLRVP
jgi:hypothetical protein